MKQITALEPQTRAGGRRVNLFLDGKFAFSLGQELVARLSVGSALSEEEIDALRRQDGLRQVYDAALSLLSYRPRSVAEVRARLVRRSFDPQLIEETLEQLKSQKVVDDEDFAQFWVENRQTYSPRGGRVLHGELRSKGIEREIIDEVLPGPEQEEASAYLVGQRKARSLKALEWREFRQRLGDHLLRRGFDYETAASVTRRLWEEAQSTAAGEEGCGSAEP